MADDVVSVRSAQLFEILGAALVAVVKADAQAARTTLEFVESVGFVQAAPPTTGPAPDPVLRMASFRYTKRDENNDLADFTAEVPVLSLLAIPALQVQRATISMAIKVDDIIRRDDPQPPGGGGSRPLRPEILGIVGRRRTELIARPAPTPAPTANAGQTSASSQIQVEIRLQQADVPAGMARLFDLMEQAITDRPA